MWKIKNNAVFSLIFEKFGSMQQIMIKSPSYSIYENYL